MPQMPQMPQIPQMPVAKEDVFLFNLETSYLHYLAFAGDIAKTQDYLAKSRGSFTVDTDGLTAIEIAILRQNYQIVNILIKRALSCPKPNEIPNFEKILE